MTQTQTLVVLPTYDEANRIAAAVQQLHAARQARNAVTVSAVPRMLLQP